MPKALVEASLAGAKCMGEMSHKSDRQLMGAFGTLEGLGLYLPREVGGMAEC